MASDDLEKAKQAYREGRYADAASRIEGLLREESGDETLWLMLERAYEKNGQKEEAALSAFFSPETLQRAAQGRRPGETLGSVLLRMNLETLERMIEAVLGRGNLPQGYSRPFSERLGTLAVGKKQIILKQALGRQAREMLPLGALLERFGLSPASIREALAKQAPLVPILAEGDNLDALLLRWKVEDRTPEIVERAGRYRRELARALSEGRRRLGAALIARGSINLDQLEKALAWQVDQPYPLGELLVQHRLCPPEAVIAALQEQLQGYRDDVEALLPPLPRKEPAEERAEGERRKIFQNNRNKRNKVLLRGGLAGVALVALAFTLKPFVPLPWLRAEVDSAAPPPLVRGERGRLGEATVPLEPGQLDPGGADAVRLPNNYEKAAAESSWQGSSELSPRPLGSFEPRKGPAPSGERGPSGSPGAVFSRVVGESGNSLSAAPSSGYSGFRSELSRESAVSPQGGVARSAGESSRKSAEGVFERRGASPRQAGNGGKFEKSDPELIRVAEQRLGGVFQSEHSKAGGAIEAMDDEVKDGRNVRRNGAVFRARLAEARLRNKEVRSAASEFLAAIALDPSVALPYYHLGTILEAEGDPEGARAHYERYLKYAPNSEFSEAARERLRKLKR